MYKKGIYKILTNEPLTDAVWRMTLAGDTQWISAPGQFVNIALEGKYLRRPISICDYDNRSIALIYKVVGGGTEQMSRMLPGETLDLLTGLGNGFSTKNDARRPLLVGGGVGVPPLYNAVEQDGQLSFEERMGCGFGACMGCSCKTKYGYKRICKEGPVLTKDEIIW